MRRAQRASAHPRAYYQREAPGRALSATFLADAQRAWILGFNALAFRTLGDAPFCYGGAATCSVAPALEREMQARLNRLVWVTGLRGLNGIDFLLDGSDVHALEVNPRPTATFELYDADYAHGLVDWHIRSFAGPLLDFPEKLAQGRRPARAYAIVYARACCASPRRRAISRAGAGDLPMARNDHSGRRASSVRVRRGADRGARAAPLAGAAA